MIRKAIQRAVQNKEVLMLYGHYPGKDSTTTDYQFDIGLLQFILEEANANDLEFYRVTDLAHQ